MCLNNLSNAELVALASSISIFIGENVSSEEAGILSGFFSAIGDNLAIFSANTINIVENTNASNSSCENLK